MKKIGNSSLVSCRIYSLNLVAKCDVHCLSNLVLGYVKYVSERHACVLELCIAVYLCFSFSVVLNILFTLCK